MARPRKMRQSAFLSLTGVHEPLLRLLRDTVNERFGWSRQEASDAVALWLRCLVAMALHRHAPVAMPARPRQVWREALMETRAYAALCHSVSGGQRLVPHSAHVAPDDYPSQVEAMRLLHQQMFGAWARTPDALWQLRATPRWPPAAVSGSTCCRELYERAAAELGLHRHQIVMLVEGTLVPDAHLPLGEPGDAPGQRYEFHVL